VSWPSTSRCYRPTGAACTQPQAGGAPRYPRKYISSTAAMGVSVARVSQIEHGEVTSFEVIARYVEALGGRLDLVADFGDRTVRLPVSDTATTA
jgi:hypothetical protein